MSNLSEFIGGGRLCTQEFLSSGTFTPSTRLLALGGVVLVEAIGGGASGAARWSNSASVADQGASGGDAGQYVEALVTVTAAVAVTIGAGGVRASAAFGDNKDGLSGGATSFGALLTAAGGVCPLLNAGSNVIAKAGDGARSPGASLRPAGVLLGTTGGRGINGKGGGGAAASIVTATAGVSLATDGGGNGMHSNITPTADVLGNSATANSGAGGGGIVVLAPTAAFAVKSGAGGTGWLRVTWFE